MKEIDLQPTKEGIYVTTPSRIGLIIGMISQQPRKKSTRRDRTTPCVVCRYPLSQKHHVLSMQEYAETGTTLQLCANCHELLHLMERFAQTGSVHCEALLDAYWNASSADHQNYKTLVELCNGSQKLREDAWTPTAKTGVE